MKTAESAGMVEPLTTENAAESAIPPARIGDYWPPDAFAWFDREGMTRTTVAADERGGVLEDVRPPVVALGPRDEDFVWAPLPERQGYPGKPLGEMRVEDYNTFLYRWLEVAVRAGDVQCAYCGRLILDDYQDLPDRDTWDAILIEQELVAWMVVHFDCKKPLPKKLKGMHPFDLAPRDPPTYDLSEQRADF